MKRVPYHKQDKYKQETGKNTCSSITHKFSIVEDLNYKLPETWVEKLLKGFKIIYKEQKHEKRFDFSSHKKSTKK